MKYPVVSLSEINIFCKIIIKGYKIKYKIANPNPNNFEK